MSVENIVYKKLRSSGATLAGACGMIGNLQAESGLKPNNLENLCEQRLRENGVFDASGNPYTDESYTEAVDSGGISKSEFLSPLPGKQYGYGLAQWTSPNRKAGLYDMAKKRGVSIADPDAQVDYLIQELKDQYPSVRQVLTSTESVNTASDLVLVKFESPANTSEDVKKYRASLGQKYYEMFENKEETVMSKVTAEKIIKTAEKYLGCKESDGSHKKIIDLYNSHKPVARGYKVKYTDPYCDAFVSAVAIEAGAVNLIGTECGCEEHIEIFKEKGIWIEDGRITPELGYIIVFNWDDTTQPNDGYSDHIGYVKKVSSGKITTIEGNYDDAVKERVISIGDGRIRGYAAPKYAESANADATEECKVTLPVLRKGDKNNYVKAVQRMLRQKGYKGIDGKPLTIDGEYGDSTAAAVELFQKNAKYTKQEPGVMTAKTWDRLLRSY